MSDHRHLVMDDDRSRRFAQLLGQYLRHVCDEREHSSPRIEPEYDVMLPGLGAIGAVVYPAFEGLDPASGQPVQVPRVIVPSFQWNQDPQMTARWHATYFAQWMHQMDPNAGAAMLAMVGDILTAFRQNPALSLHVFGLGVFMIDPVGGLFSLSPELLYSLNARTPFAPDDRDLRVPDALVQGMNDNQLCTAAIDHLWHSLPPIPQAITKLFGQRVSPGQLYTFATSWLCREIAQGGFMHFFENPPGDLAAMALEGLERIGATPYADILRRAMSVFPSGYPQAHQERVAYLQKNKRSISDQLDACSRDFFALLESQQGLERYMAAFIRQHPQQFLRAA